MASLEELRAERVRKLHVLQEKGIDPYPASSAREFSMTEILDRFDQFITEQKVVTDRPTVI